MESFYYVVSDSSTMDWDDFLLYVGYLKTIYSEFIFEEWFDKADFNSEQTFLMLKDIVES